MNKYLVYPEGYRPMVAAGQYDVSLQKYGIEPWTLEDTLKMRELEKQAIISHSICPPTFRWHQKLD